MQNLVTKDGVWSSYHDERIRLEPHLDELTPHMAWIDKQKFAKPVVHIIDREAASIVHQRQWDKDGRLFVVRDKGGSRVKFNGREVKLGEVADSLDFQATYEVFIKIINDRGQGMVTAKQRGGRRGENHCAVVLLALAD